MKLRTTLISILLSLHFVAGAQYFSVESFGLAEGLEELFLNTIVQGDDGFLYAGTASGIVRYGGDDFERFFPSDTTISNNITAAINVGGKVYFGHADGAVTMWNARELVTILPAEGNHARVVAMRENNSGFPIILRQDGSFIRVDGDQFLTQELSLDGAIPFDLIVFDDKSGGILTDFGMLRIEGAELLTEWSTALDGYPLQRGIKTEDGSILIGVEDEGVFLFDPSKDEVIDRWEPNETKGWKVSDIAHQNGQTWLATSQHGVFKLNLKNGIQCEPLLDDSPQETSINAVLLDNEDNAWMSIAGQGLKKVSPEPFKNFRERKALAEWITDVEVVDGNIITASSNKICTFDPALDSLVTSYETPAGSAIRALYAENEKILVGSDPEGIQAVSSAGEVYDLVIGNKRTPIQSINDIARVKEYLFVATDFGIYQLKDGKVISHLSVVSGLPHNKVLALYVDDQERMWIGTKKSGIAYIEQGQLINVRLPMDQVADVTDFVLINQNLWIATAGQGLISYNIETEEVQDRYSGLLSPYCYSIEAVGDQVYVGHRGGMSFLNTQETTASFYRDTEIAFKGIDIHDLALDEDNEVLYIATQNGLFSYDPAASRKNIPAPITSIGEVLIADSSYALDQSISLPYGKYAFEFSFEGVSFSSKDDIQFEHFLEGHEPNWSEPLKDKRVRYSQLPPGDYTFHVRAVNRRSSEPPIEKQIHFNIALPFWKSWWFYPAAFLTVIVLVRAWFYRREQKLKRDQEYLQTELDMRTKEVVKQKMLVEIKNKDITDSIRYAQNIQKAILPQTADLQRHFNEGFVYFRPRDIVSGDFYWLERFGDSVLLACVDCTGHGVPGALMSMIGTALLKDVSRNDEVKSPSQLLEFLDTEIKAMLSRQEGDFLIQDGMDMGIIEYQISSKTLRFAGARRPLVLFKGGEMIEYKGDRSSIGGEASEEKKEFTNYSIQLEEGDTFYMFSDGLTDQFGGDKGKKFKKSRAIELFQRIQTMNMDVQRDKIDTTLRSWQGEEEQVDDMLVLGVRI